MLMPEPSSHRFLDRLNIVELHHDRHCDPVLPEEAVELAPNDHLFVERDEVLAVQIRGRKHARRAQADATDKPPPSSALRATESPSDRDGSRDS